MSCNSPVLRAAMVCALLLVAPTVWSERLSASVPMVSPAPAPQQDAGEAVHDGADEGSAEIERLVRDLCDKELVLLGEDASHGSGHTFEIKTRIVQRLIERCGFGAVAFESQVYDFLDFRRSLVEGAPTREGLRNAIGGLWMRAAEGEPLLDTLFDAAVAGRVQLGGLDPQVGGAMGLFARTQLAERLAGVLAGPRRAVCADALGRHNDWRYDKAHAFDEAARRELSACAADIQAAVAAGPYADSGELVTMARSYLRYVEMAIGGDPDARDRGMFENLQWYRAHVFKGAKTVVWCATSHAVKRVAEDARMQHPLGVRVHAGEGDRAAAIGFSALGGTWGNPGGKGAPNALAMAAPGSLEAAAFEGRNAHALVYMDAARLAELGTVSARAVNYRNSTVAPWGAWLDGIIVLREERPTLQQQESRQP